ncbi:MAG: right-handed parallel beta-helix repeat-containing protein, partial [Candidatus Woesearchaeota archaeon]
TNDYSAFYSSGYDNLTIKNCVISNFVGINILNSEGHKILNNSIARTSGSVQYKGISFSDVNNSNISKNTLRYMEDAGILISRGYNDKITENKIYNSMSGVSLIAATNSVSKNLIKDNQIYNLTAGGGTVCAIYVEDNADQIQGNIIDCGNYSDSNFKGISLYGSNAENNSLSGNDVRGCYYGFDSSGQLNFTIDSDEYYENNYGIYLSSTGGSALWPVIKNSDIHDNGEGITMSGAKASIINTNFNRNAVSSSTGIYVNGSSIAYITNGEFLNNGDYAILDNAPGSVYWTINSAAKCINNSVVIADGNITFDNGTLELNNCLLTIPDGQGGSIQINQTGTISSLDFEVKAVTAYTPEEFNFSESSVVLNLSDNVTTTITVTGMTPESSPSGFTALKGIDITVDSTTEGALVSALIKIFYSDAELTAANIDENSLKIYYYNETAGAWQLEPDQGVDTVNNYVWARVTHLSSYGAFGKGISGGSSGRSGGGGGGGGSFYRRNQTTAITANTVMACQDDWICDVWSECINGMMTRECVLNDYPNCLTAAAKPATQSACTAQPSEASKPAEAATAPKASPIVDTVKQGLAGVANIAGQGMSALTKQVGIGIAILVVIGGLAAYLLLSKK